MKGEEKFIKIWSEIVARAWSDETFKKRLFEHTEQVFKEYGLSTQAGVHYKIVEERPAEVTIIFPHHREDIGHDKHFEKFRKSWVELVERAWSDEKFKKRLFEQPEKVFKEYGLPMTKHDRCRIIEESPHEIIIVFPYLSEEISEETLKKITAGRCHDGAICF
jgi:hypothetical protein